MTESMDPPDTPCSDEPGCVYEGNYYDDQGRLWYLYQCEEGERAYPADGQPE